MAKMKDSSIEWIGQIPEDWGLVKFKFNLSVHEVKGYGDKEVLSLYRELGVIPKNSRDDNHNVTSEDTSKYKYVRKGDFVINKMKAWQGSVAVSDYEGIVSPAYYVYEFKNNSYVKRYFHHLLRNKTLAEEFRRISSGIREGQWDLNRIDFENLYLTLPPPATQQKIADFLDSKCSKIDSLSADIKKQIELLENYKRSVITEAVTRGINPDTKMKDSHIDDFGQIPFTWEDKKIKYLFQLITELNYLPIDKVQLLSLYTHLGVFPHGEQEERGNKAVTVEGYKIVHKNDLVVNIILAWMGAMGISNYDGVTSPAYDIYRPLSNNVDPKFYHYVFRTPWFAGECDKYGRGIMRMRWRTYSQEFMNIKIPYPPLSEQKAIAKYLDSKCAKIDSVIASKNRQLAKLDEYKRSLIFEYVTGKKEVVQIINT